METRIVGKSTPNIDGFQKVTGKSTFTADIKLARMLVGKVLRSKFPHAKILSINTKKATQIRGVKAVVTGKEIPATYNLAIKDQPFLAIDKVRYLGEPVAAVAAVDEDTAEEALRLIEVEYEELKPLYDPLEAMNLGAPLIHEDIDNYIHDPNFEPVKSSNICNHFKLRKGDIEQGFKESDYVIEDVYRTQMVQHTPLETHAAIAVYDPLGKLTIWTNAQSPFVSLYELSRSLDIPESKIRIIVPNIGGGFGSKHNMHAEPLAVALALKMDSVPVKVVFTREEQFTSSVVRGPTIVELKTGVKSDGRLIAREARIIWDTGAYADCAPLLCRNASYSAGGPYFIPNQKIDGYCVYTNKNIGAAYRGFGLVEMSWAYETHTDMIAEKLGIDPLEIRLKNVFEEGSVSGTGQVLHSVGLKECLRIVAERIGWNKEKVKKNRGRGIACAHKSSHAPTASSAAVRINNDGSVTVMAGTTDLGQDPRTIFAQIASEELGVPLERISVSFPDTDYTPWDRSTSSSRGTFHMGNAVRLAAADAKKQLFELAFDFLGGDTEKLDTKGGRVFITSDPNKAVTFKDLIAVKPRFKAGPIIGRGVYYPTDATGLDLETGQGGRVTAFWMYCAQAAEVEVDEETGQVNVLRIVAAHDVGKAINPIRVEGQIEGGIVMGMGSALTEELIIEDGKTVNCNLVDYKIPTSLDVPDMEPIIVEEPHRDGPYGAKGIGEAPATPTAPAIGNAVFDAVGVRIKDLPMTSEKVFWALKKKPRTS